MSHAVKLMKKYHAIDRMEKQKKKIEFLLGFKATVINTKKEKQKRGNNESLGNGGQRQ